MKEAAFAAHRVKNLKVLRDQVLVAEMNFQGRQLSSGVILLNDNGKSQGIRARWGQVYAVGPEQQDVRVGDWICVAHGRWTRGIEIDDNGVERTIRRIDPNDILLVSDEQPQDDTMGTAEHVESKHRFA